MAYLETASRWKWAMLGLALRVWLAYVKLLSSDQPARQMSEQEFESRVTATALDGNPVLCDITIRPTVSGYEITGKRRTVPGIKVMDVRYDPFVCDVPRIYQPIMFKVSAKGYELSVVSFMDSLSVKHPLVKYSYAWWDGTIATYGIAIALGIVSIGGAWPGMARVIRASRYGRIELLKKNSPPQEIGNASTSNDCNSQTSTNAAPAPMEHQYQPRSIRFGNWVRLRWMRPPSGQLRVSRMAANFTPRSRMRHSRIKRMKQAVAVEARY